VAPEMGYRLPLDQDDGGNLRRHDLDEDGFAKDHLLDFGMSPSAIATRIIALTAFWKSRRLLIAQ
jgi:hypothetical protein